MLNKIRSHSVFRNSVALMFVQIANYLVPLLTLPYLTRKLGVSVFGEVAIVLAVIQLCRLMTDYGFSMSAVPFIARNKEDKKTIATFLSSVLCIKAMLLLFCILALFFVPAFFSQYVLLSTLFQLSILAVIGQALQINWFFQGIQQMKNATYYLVLTKILYAIFIFLFIHSSEDAKYVIIAWGIAHLLGGLLCWVLLFREGFYLTLPKITQIFYEFKESWAFFVGRLAVSCYTSLNAVVTGFSGTTQAAFYGANEQLYKAGQNFFTPVSSALYPYMVEKKDWKLFKKLIGAIFIILLIGVTGAIFLSEWIVTLFFGADFSASAPVFTLFMITVLVSFFNIVLGYPLFATINKIKVANYTIYIGAISHLIGLFLLYMTGNISALNVVMMLLVTETIILLSRLTGIYIYRRLFSQDLI